MPATAGLAEWSLNLLNGPGGADEAITGSAQFLTALTGGFLTGWGVMVFALRAWVFDQAPDGVRLAGLVAWFVVDSSASIAHGAPLNAASNVGFLALGLLPMLAVARGSTSATSREHASVS